MSGRTSDFHNAASSTMVFPSVVSTVALRTMSGASIRMVPTANDLTSTSTSSAAPSAWPTSGSSEASRFTSAYLSNLLWQTDPSARIPPQDSGEVASNSKPHSSHLHLPQSTPISRSHRCHLAWVSWPAAQIVSSR